MAYQLVRLKDTRVSFFMTQPNLKESKVNAIMIMQMDVL